MNKCLSLVLLISLLFSCAQKKEPVAKTDDQIIIELAAPQIANEIGDLDLNVALTKNKSLSLFQREEGLNWMAKNEYDYMTDRSFSIANIDKNTPGFADLFNKRYELQRNYIISKWKAWAKQQLYKQRLTEQIIKENK